MITKPAKVEPVSEQALPDVLASLSRAVASLTAPQRTWWTLADIADELQLHVDTVSRGIVCRADFPAPSALTDSLKERRWRRVDVLEWVEGRQLPKGRARRTRKAAAAA